MFPMGCGASNVIAVPQVQASRNAWTSDTTGRGCPTLYVWPASAPCRAVMMTCSAADIEVNLMEVNLTDGHHETDSFAKINPHRTVPVLNVNGFILSESRAIMTYLVSKCARRKDLYPLNLEDRARVDRFLQFDIGTLSKAINDYTFPILFPGSPRAAKADDNLRSALDLLENDLKGVQYAIGSQLTLADLSMAASLGTLDLVNFDIGKWRLVSRLVTQLKALPFYEECNVGLRAWKEQLEG